MFVLSYSAWNCRFDGEFPRLPDIRRALDTEMRCDAAGDEEDSAAVQQNDSGTRSPPASPSLHHLDASLFYASPPPSHEDSELSITRAPVSGPSSPVLTLSDITVGLNVDLLRAVFLLSDLVVLVYRLTATYVTVRALRRRFASGPTAARPRRAPPGFPPAVVPPAVVQDSGSTLRSSSSRTALTSTGSSGPDASNIYVDPQSLVVDNCSASVVRRPPGGGAVDVTSSAPVCPPPRRYSSGTSDVV